MSFEPRNTLNTRNGIWCYKTLGTGFLEGVYQEALELELASRGIPYKSQPEIVISYKGTRLHQTYRADIICYDSIILELKAAK